MKTRIIAGLCMLPLLVIVYLGKEALLVASFLISIIAYLELSKGFSEMNIRLPLALGMAFSIIYYFPLAFKVHEFLLPAIMLVSIVALVYLFASRGKDVHSVFALVFSFVYVIVLPSSLYLLDFAGYGKIIWLVLLISFGTDVFAYFTGFFIGKRKLCEDISPKKTIEGAIGGILGSLVLASLFGIIAYPQHRYEFMLLGVLGSVVAQAGDLIASMLKRNMGIKDFGNLIPGHGGILDRFDSVILVSPFVYCYVSIFIMK